MSREVSTTTLAVAGTAASLSGVERTEYMSVPQVADQSYPRSRWRLLVVFSGIAVDKREFDGVKRKKPVFVPSGVYVMLRSLHQQRCADTDRLLC